MTDDLIARLRETWNGYYGMDERHLVNPDGPEAADRIEELEAWKAAEEAHHHMLRAEAAENARIIGMSAEREMALRGEVERLRAKLEPQWFYAGEDQSSDQCRFSIDEVLEDELCGWGPPKTGRHVVHVSTALPGPDIWVAVHVFTDEEKDARGDDETWAFEEFSTEAEARAALEGTSHE